MYFNNMFIQFHFLNASKYNIDVLHHAVTQMEPDICTKVEANFSGHLQNIPRYTLYKTHSLPKHLVVSRQVKVKVYGMRNLISCQTTQALLANKPDLVGSVEGLTTVIDTSAAAASSASSTMSSTSNYGLAYQDKNTLSQNMEPMSMPWHSSLCFGCHGNHRLSEVHGTKIVCPFQNHPGVKSKVEKNISTLCKYHKSSGKRSKFGRGSSDKGGSNCSYIGDNPDFGCMIKTQKSASAVNLVPNKGKL